MTSSIVGVLYSRVYIQIKAGAVQVKNQMGANLPCPDGWEGSRLERGHSISMDSSLWQVISCGDTPHIVRVLVQ